MRDIKHTRRGKAPAGFTLVELLVVIVIIGILAALITVVAANAVARANETAIKVELDNLANSFSEYKNRYGAYPPNVPYLGGLSPQQSQEREGNFKRHLRKAFPRHRETDADINSLLALNLTPAESVWLFLRGFSPDPEHPLTGPGTRLNDNRASLERLFDFDEARLVPTRTWTVPSGGIDIQLMAYIPDGITQPFVYFDTSRTLTTPDPFPVLPYYQPPGAPSPLVVPYLERDPRNPAAVRFVNPDSFQIISAGLDDDFGPPLTNPPNDPLVPEGPFVRGHSDNLANFSQRNMEDSQP